MEIGPILSAFKKNKTGALLLVVQIALTLAVLSNVVAIVIERAALVSRSTGMEEHNLFALGYRLTQGDGSYASLESDLAAIRATPGVVDAVPSNSFPLRGSGWGEGVNREPGVRPIQLQTAQSYIYALDSHALGTLGLKLIAGRNFTRQETLQGDFNQAPLPNVAILSSSVAQQLFPGGDAVGKSVYITADAGKSVTVVGVVARLQTPVAANSADEHDAENSVILPMHAAAPFGLYLVRTRPGMLDATMREVQNTLTRINPNRIFGRLRPFDEIRHQAYERDRAMAVALAIVCVILITITALGIVGITSLWIAQRRRQIGIRRALGATRLAIVKRFLTENALLCGAGVAVGAVASRALGVWLFVHFGSDPVGAAELLISAFAVVSLGQCAALIPSLLAARISPAEAFRAH